jgi:NADH-quinone oxidoreductase subunit J
MSQYLFYILSFLTLFSAMMVVFSRKAVYSVLYMIFCFFTIAGHYILLNAQFLAAVHVIVYSGAIMVLFLYVIMMLNQNFISEAQKTNIAKTTAVAAGGILMVVLVGIFKSADGLVINPAVDDQIGMVETLGITLYRDFLLPFEVSALLFLTAMIGATLIGKKENTEA